MMHSQVGYRFLLCWFYSSYGEVPLLAWKACEIFRQYPTLNALHQFYHAFLADDAAHRLESGVVEVDAINEIELYLRNLVNIGVAPALPFDFCDMLKQIQSQLLAHISRQVDSLKLHATPLWQSYVTGQPPPLELKRINRFGRFAKRPTMTMSTTTATVAGSAMAPTSGEQALGPSPPSTHIESKAERNKRVECIQNILAGSMLLNEYSN